MKLFASPLSLLVLALISLPGAAAEQHIRSEKEWLKYYSERLPEAKQMLQVCVAKGFNKIQGEERVKCEVARDAWHFQPYKPNRK